MFHLKKNDAQKIIQIHFFLLIFFHFLPTCGLPFWGGITHSWTPHFSPALRQGEARRRRVEARKSQGTEKKWNYSGKSRRP
jgi:hypothetical protein